MEEGVVGLDSIMNKLYLYKKSLFDLWQRKSIRQIVGLLSVNTIGIPLAIFTNILVTRYLGPELFGDYKFICSIFNLSALLVTLGFFQAGNRAIVLAKENQRIREFYGAILIVLFLLYVLMSLGLLIFAHFDSNLSDKGLTSLFIPVIPLGLIPLWNQLYETILPASNKIGYLSKIRLFPKLINLVAACFLYYCAQRLPWNRLIAILLVYNLSQMITFIYVAFKLKPTLKDLKNRLKEIFTYNAQFGFNVYIGALFAVGLGYLTEILISYFGVNNVDVGYYSLSITLTQPLTFIPATIATTHYKSFASAPRIPPKIILTTLSLSGLSVIALWLLIPPFIRYFYGNEFLPVIGINFFVCIAVFLHGYGDFINRFIQAKGKGVMLRNASIVVGLATLLSNVLLIPSYGAYGAAFSKIINGLVYVAIIYYFYRKTIKDETI